MTNVTKLTLIAGGVLVLVGLISYIASGAASLTALIPSGIGVLLLIAARIGRKPELRRHAMHVAMLIALIGIVLDQLAPGGPSTYTLEHFRIAMSVQFLFWGVGVIQLVRYRRKSLRHLEEVHPAALDALRSGETLLPGISRPEDPRP